MLYDLNKIIDPYADIDSFRISGHSYEIGPVSWTIRSRIANIDEKKDLIKQIRPIVESVMHDWNDEVHILKDTEIEAIFKLIIQKMNVTNNPQVQVS